MCGVKHATVSTVTEQTVQESHCSGRVTAEVAVLSFCEVECYVSVHQYILEFTSSNSQSFQLATQNANQMWLGSLPSKA